MKSEAQIKKRIEDNNKVIAQIKESKARGELESSPSDEYLSSSLSLVVAAQNSILNWVLDNES
jgi:hypothetical protein